MKLLAIMFILLANIAYALPITTQVWSDSLGAEIGVKVYDIPGEPRYESGAPICIHVPGGWSSSGFSPPTVDLLEEGVMQVTFLLPGDTMEGVSTGGTYDLRGPNCLHVMKDVIRFAAGKIPDSGGDYIGDLFPFDIDTGNVGLLMGSNGGNLGIVTLGTCGAELEGCVHWLVGMENPSSPQTCLPDLGVHEMFPDIDGDGNGIFGDDYKNPWHLAYGDTFCPVDYTHIAYDSSATTSGLGAFYDGAVFLDGNGNGLYDEIMVDSMWTPDINGNGVIDTTEDYRFNCLELDGMYYFSTPVAEALYAALGPSDYPGDIAHPDSTANFWYYRAMVFHFENVADHFPEIAYIPTFTLDDHVQVTRDKTHIRQAYNGFSRNNLWVRLNPDKCYANAYFTPDPLYPDNPANLAPLNWLAINGWSYAEEAPHGLPTACAVLELADRRHYDVWRDPNLDYVLEQRTEDFPPIYCSVVSHSEEPPGTPDYGDNPAVFEINRAALLEFALMLDSAGIDLNWQSEWNFARGVAMHDDGSGTGGMNIVEFMHDSLGFEIDPHAHQSVYNYADVAHFIEELGVTPTGTVGGFVAWPESMSILEQFFDTIEADSFPGYSWTPEILWGAATRGHVDEETLYISGVWKPRDNYHFFEHDESRLPHIGNYTRDWFGVRQLLNISRTGDLDEGKIYTSAIFVGQGGLNSAETDSFRRQIDAVEEYEKTDWLRWRTLGEIHDIWLTEYDSIPNMFWPGGGTSVGADEAPATPADFAISAYPNPFNSAVTINVKFSPCKGGDVRRTEGVNLEIYDVNGRRVETLRPSATSGTGPSGLEKVSKEVPLLKGDLGGSYIWQPAAALSSGVYLARARFGGCVVTRRLVYLK